MGLYPALQSSRADIVDALKEGGRGTAGSVRQQRFRKLLVGAQVALSVTLLAGASLLIASFVRLSHQDPGFQARQSLDWADRHAAGAISRRRVAHPFRGATHERVARHARPSGSSVSGGFPLFNGGGATLYTRADGNVPPVAERKGAPSNDVMPGWFRDPRHSTARGSRLQ